MKPDVHLRSAFDSASRKVTRKHAARVLRAYRSSARRVPIGWKILIGFEPAVISRQAIDQPVNF